MLAYIRGNRCGGRPEAVVATVIVALLSACPAAMAEWADHSLRVEVSGTPDSDFGPDRSLSARDHQLEWRAPAWRLGGTTAHAGARYAYTRYSYSGVASRDRDLHQLQIPLSLAGDKGAWRWRLHAAPGVAASSNVTKDLLDRATSDDLFATGGLLASRDFDAGTLAVGVAHDRRFGRSLSYPRVAWRVGTSRFEWQLGAPDAWLDFRPREGTTLSVGAGPAGMQWHTVRDDFESDFDYRVRRWDVRLDLRQRIAGSVSLSLHLGRGFDRRHQFEADAVTRLDLDAEDAWYGGVGLVVGVARRDAGYARAF